MRVRDKTRDREQWKKVKRICAKLENSIYENPTETYDGKPTDEYLANILTNILQDDTFSFLFDRPYSRAYGKFEEEIDTCITMYEGYIINFIKELHGVIYPITDNDEIDEGKLITNRDNLYTYTELYGKIYNLLVRIHNSIESPKLFHKVDCLSEIYDQILDYESYGFDISEYRKDMCITCGAMLSSIWKYCNMFIHRYFVGMEDE